MNEQDNASVQWFADELHRHGLATPALMLLDLLVPVSFIGEHVLRAVGPLLPFDRWRDLALGLRDARQRDLLQHLLAASTEDNSRRP